MQAAREAARDPVRQQPQAARAACQNHEQQQDFFRPAAGAHWSGDPDRGFGLKQPGGWVYNILPFLELPSLHDLGHGETDDVKKTDLTQCNRTVVPAFGCPSRRAVALYPYTATSNLYNCNARTSSRTFGLRDQRRRLLHGRQPIAGAGLVSDDLGSRRRRKRRLLYLAQHVHTTGICYQRSKIRANDITDGLSNTYLVGEKSLRSDQYYTGQSGDNETMYTGMDIDTVRLTSTMFSTTIDQNGPGEITTDHPNGVAEDNRRALGSTTPTVSKWPSATARSRPSPMRSIRRFTVAWATAATEKSSTQKSYDALGVSLHYFIDHPRRKTVEPAQNPAQA